MKTINKIWLMSGAVLLLSMYACKKNKDFVKENTVETGVGYYPISGNSFIDLTNGGAITATRVYNKGQSLSYELQFFSQSPIKEINIYETLAGGTRNKIQNIPYKPAFSKAKGTDTLVVNYQVPATAPTGVAKIESEIVNQNTLSLLRNFTFKVN